MWTCNYRITLQCTNVLYVHIYVNPELCVSMRFCVTSSEKKSRATEKTNHLAKIGDHIGKIVLIWSNYMYEG